MPVWLQDISLIVPVDDPRRRRRRLGHPPRRGGRPAGPRPQLTSVTFMFVFSPSTAGSPRGALLPGDAVAAGPDLARPHHHPRDAGPAMDPAADGAGVLAVVVVIATGHVSPGLTLSSAGSSPSCVVAVFLLASYKGTIGAIAGLALLLSCAQLLQNSRGDLGLYYLSPYNWASAPTPSTTSSARPSTRRSGCCRRPPATTGSCRGSTASGWTATASCTWWRACSCGART